jgi:hypothetical protein
MLRVLKNVKNYIHTYLGAQPSTEQMIRIWSLEHIRRLYLKLDNILF